MNDVNSEEVVKALGTESMNLLKGRTYAYADNSWIVLRMNELQEDNGSLRFLPYFSGVFEGGIINTDIFRPLTKLFLPPR